MDCNGVDEAAMNWCGKALRTALFAAWATSLAHAQAPAIPLSDPQSTGEFSETGQVPMTSGTQSEDVPQLPATWWNQSMQTPLGIAARHTVITADEAMLLTLTQSPDIQVFQVQPQIEFTEITRQKAAFDWNTFLDSSWNDRSDPIGSSLTTGSLDGRFRDRLLGASGGVKRTTTSGTSVELAQRMGWQANNSAFLVPNPQSTSRLELAVTQPLMAGRGESYQLRRVVEARLIAEGTQADALAKIQNALLQVHQRYWDLYRTRAVFLQRRRAVERAESLTQSLQARTGFDTTGRQLVRSQTAVAQHRAVLMTAAANADIAAIELRRLIGMADYESELVPVQGPRLNRLTTDTGLAIQTAISRRPEIESAVREIKIAGVRVGASRNELMPKLDLIAGAYVAGLTPNRTFGDPIGSQFSVGRPTYNMGLAWERPAGMRASQSVAFRRQLELQESLAKYETALQDVRRDVEVALRQVQLTYHTLLQRHESLAAVQGEADFLYDRWKMAPNSDGPSILLLEDLIAAQSRLADEEASLATTEAEHAMAQVKYLRAIGTLIQTERTANIDDLGAQVPEPGLIESEDDR